MRKKEGITLVALVITVIIMLILAGVALSSILGKDGLFGMVSYSAKKYAKSAQDEAYILNELLSGEYNSGPTTINPEKPSDNKKYDIIVAATNLSSRYEQTVDLSGFEGYKNFNVDNFFIINEKFEWASGSDGEEIAVISKDYDPQTGILTLGKQKSYSSWGSIWTFYNIYDVYIIQPPIESE